MPHPEPISLAAENFPGQPLGSNERDIVDTEAVVRFIRNRRRLCVIWTVAGLCAGITFWMFSPAYYTAYATLLLEDPLSRPVATPVSGADAAATAYIESQVFVLLSDEVVARTVDQLLLTKDEEFGQAAGGIRALIVSFLSAGEATIDHMPRYRTTLRIRGALSVRRLGVSNAVEVGFTSRNPHRSAAIANAIVQSYMDSRSDLERKAREDAATQLRERLAALRSKAFAVTPPQDLSTTSQSPEQAEARSRELQSNAEGFGALYDSLLRRAYADSEPEFSSLRLRVITPAELPLRRSWPPAILVLAIVVAGGAAGICHALLKEATDHSVKTAADVWRLTGINRIAEVPRIEGQSWKIGGSRAEGLQPSYALVSGKFDTAMGKVAVRLQQEENRRSGLVIGVAAPGDGAGTSSVAAHLARTLTESGHKILLVDANWRKPSTRQAMLNSSPSRKLGRRHATIHLGDENTEVLVLRATDAISEMNASLSIVSTLQLLHVEYDYVVVDFPAAEQTVDLEASMTVINDVIVVVEAGRTTSESLYGLLRMIPRAKLASVVLNKI